MLLQGLFKTRLARSRSKSRCMMVCYLQLVAYISHVAAKWHHNLCKFCQLQYNYYSYHRTKHHPHRHNHHMEVSQSTSCDILYCQELQCHFQEELTTVTVPMRCTSRRKATVMNHSLKLHAAAGLAPDPTFIMHVSALA